MSEWCEIALGELVDQGLAKFERALSGRNFEPLTTRQMVCLS
jgi:hypothetical protein